MKRITITLADEDIKVLNIVSLHMNALYALPYNVVMSTLMREYLRTHNLNLHDKDLPIPQVDVVVDEKHVSELSDEEKKEAADKVLQKWSKK